MQELYESGGIVYLNVLGNSIVILNDSKYALDMLDKKSRIYSDRPTLTMAGTLVGWDEGPALIPFCDTWSEYRRLFAQFMGTHSKVYEFEEVLQDENNIFLKRLLANPNNWVDHARKFAGGIVLTLAYGYKAGDDDDRMVRIVNEAMDQFSETTKSSAFLVDVFPTLRYVPSWFPGAAWKKKVPKYAKSLQTMLDSPYAWVKQQISSGTAKKCFVSDLLDNRTSTQEKERIIKWAAAGIYSGGADTTVAGIESFVLAMTLQIAAQKKAQAEIDSVIGTDRLLVLKDRARLPYTEALFTEVLRVYAIAPTGISDIIYSFTLILVIEHSNLVPSGLPHVSREDDIHNGYFIPKGAIVIANIWQFLKDPAMYKNPDLFLPERFMESKDHTKEVDPRDFIFGFGRRVCPGIHLADEFMWLLCVSVLAAFDIRPPVKDGESVMPTGKVLDGAICHPEPFECVIKPRSKAAEAVIRASG
ncbi:cytochrome P450 [Crucibulum laeve]|uniref:Cytochrome P450 n=1 Tax=Crucibulum laeve TaxID=68775 RepID=A0A5C3MGC1_9AGAR|nr:cytochrome P450 [Crucibulum laeve]